MIDDQKELKILKRDLSGYDGPDNHFKNEDVEISRSYEDGLAKLQSQKWDLLLLDHDLGGDKTGYDLMNWLEMNPEHSPSVIRVISFNPSGASRMIEVIKAMESKRQTRFGGYGV